MKEKITCYECGSTITEETARHLRGRTYCSECYEHETVVCDSCDERILREESESDGSTTLCRHCFEEYYIVCRDCGAFVSNDDAIYNDDTDGYYCEECYNRVHTRPIKSYSYKPDPIFEQVQ